MRQPKGSSRSSRIRECFDAGLECAHGKAPRALTFGTRSLDAHKTMHIKGILIQGCLFGHPGALIARNDGCGKLTLGG